MQRSGRVPNDQEIYAGFVKPREAKHDAELYRVYQKRKTASSGGAQSAPRAPRFRTEKKVNRDLTRLGLEKDDPDKKRDVAERHSLRSFMPAFPCRHADRIRDARPKHSASQLELTTEDYRPRLLADKARAGFTLYSHGDDASHVRRVLSDAS